GTVAGRLARARRMLADALARRGIALSAGALAAALAHHAASAAAPALLVESTIKVASLFAAGVTATGAISPRALLLTEGVLHTMALAKQKTALAIVLILLFGLSGTIIGWPGATAENRAQAQQPGAPA